MAVCFGGGALGWEIPGNVERANRVVSNKLEYIKAGSFIMN
jgi:hypothetical protein